MKATIRLNHLVIAGMIVAVGALLLQAPRSAPRPVYHSKAPASQPAEIQFEYQIAVDCQKIASNAHEDGWSYQGCVDEVQKSVDTMRHVYTSSKVGSTI
jgi:hypothetical protein